MRPSEKLIKYFPFFYVTYTLATYLSVDAYLPAMPTIGTQFNVSQEKIQLTLTLFFLGNLVSQLLMGILSEYYARRQLMLIGGIIFTVSSLLIALIPSFNLLLTARFLQGIALTSMLVTGYSTIHIFYKQDEAVKLIAWLASITIFAPTIGPILGAAIMELVNWEFIFILLALMSSLSLVGLFYSMPETLIEPENTTLRKTISEYWSILKDWNFLKPLGAWASLFAIMIAWNVCGAFLIIDTMKHSIFFFGFIQALILSGFVIGSRVLDRLISENKYSFKSIATTSGYIILASCIIGIFCIFFSPNILFNIIIILLPINFAFGLSFAIHNRLCIESNNQSLSYKVALSGLGLNTSALTSSILVSILYAQSINAFIYYILVLAIISVICSIYTSVKNKNA
ncbi:MAG: MFS transporter [Proteobacteria bacterium]|nr:MFS transporter [Pseudomonadota bacterium]